MRYAVQCSAGFSKTWAYRSPASSCRRRVCQDSLDRNGFEARGFWLRARLPEFVPALGPLFQPDWPMR
jgi:hypothetical protein